MMRHLLILWFLTPSLWCFGDGLIELAPLKAAFGYPSVRAEWAAESVFHAAIRYDSLSYRGELAPVRDMRQQFGVEGVIYFSRSGGSKPFVTAGLLYEHQRTGMRRERNYVSDIRYSEVNRYDTWLSKQTSIYLPLSAGYRYVMSGWATASLRLTTRKFLLGDQVTKEYDVRSFDFEGGHPVRPEGEFDLGLFFGVAF